MTAANLAENTPNERCWLFRSTSPRAAASQKAVAPRLPVVRAKQGGSSGGQVGHRFIAHFGWTGPESAIGRKQVGRDPDVGNGDGHVTRYRSLAGHGNQSAHPEEIT